MEYRYYTFDADWSDFEVKVRNPKWDELRKLASDDWWYDPSKVDEAWSYRFYMLTRDPEERKEALEGLQMFGWDESLLAGTYLTLRRGVLPLPDMGVCRWGHNPLPFIVHVVSPKFRALLEGLGLSDELEFEEYPLFTADGKNFLGNYYCVRYLVQLDCADEESSYIVVGLRGGTRFVVRRECLGSHRVVYVSNFAHQIVVRSDVVEAIESAGIVGCEFGELELI